MRTLAAAVVLGCSLLATPAHAQPEMCGVTFVRAPDDIRHEIERWLASERRCTTSLELRVIPTADGIYLWAQRPDGRVHERVVPDAQTAGVLVASWAADDWVDSSQPVVAPIVAPIVAMTPAPAAMAVLGRVDATPRARTAVEGGGQWITVGAAMGKHTEDFGYRASVDVTARGPWRFGAAAQYSSAYGVQTMDWNATSPQEQDWLGGLRDSKLVATVSRGMTWGGWELGGAVGVGLLYTSGQLGTVGPQGYIGDVHQLVPTVEADVMLTRRIAHGVAFGFGPLATVIHERFTRAGSPDSVRSEALVQWNGALRFAL